MIVRHVNGTRPPWMRRRAAYAVTALMLGCGGEDRPRDRTQHGDPPPRCSEDTRVTVAIDTIATGLEVPWAVAFAPDGRIFVTERPGRIRVVEQGVLRTEPWAVVDAAGGGESGLMGIALAPDFRETGHVFMVATTSRPGSTGLLRRAWRRLAGRFRRSAGLPFRTRVYRMTDHAGRGSDRRVIVDDIPAQLLHAGGALTFGPDGLLYLTIGDAQLPPTAQRPGEPLGKVLRYAGNGEIPRDNPVAGSAVYASGVRNAQGLVWMPDGMALFIDHGPTGLPSEDYRVGHDELNQLRAGADYGWPTVIGMAGAGFASPLAVWSPAIAPGGIAYYAGPYRPWRGSVFIGGLGGRQLRRVALEAPTRAGAPWRVDCDEVVIDRVLGRIRAVSVGPDGAVYVTTSNRDGRGTPGTADDMLVRVRPDSAPRAAR